MVNHKQLYQHFYPEEYPFIEKMSDMINRVDSHYFLEVTDFLNPREITILKSLVAPTDLKVFSSTDYYPSEYGRVIVVPDYYDLDEADFQIALVEITYQAKFNQLTHGQILGTLINELGIKRNLLGDIFVETGYAQLMINRQLLDYVLTTISKIARASVSLKEIPLNQLIKSSNDAQLVDIMVSSLRLDRLVATVLKKSRAQAMTLIETDKVKVNYRQVHKVADHLAIGDMVSIRGYGRFTLLTDNGLTKNGKYKLTLSKMMHK
ncbi:RNA-binding protein [Streptococcus dysgalactiae]|uniref:YlmH family RNA-binding protein n=1 Tax=Streptococcus dysgalactiae TaxID=1334 RepID=UPI0001F862DB|nr:RNA-binding protein [Streptococcus dysgalactiae]EFY03148.1 RNA binding protein [Streptococcus dysgalactiae subsp. dysgalactiae ATCC 27957]MCB2831290.1 RNA-binding protein [Streptococcus dysgalactiae subsp. dysgalactiae]MCB2834989.1 RNA-binding protein [Streptococcus dysgalactiae subsp. dysgalactiae]MCB2839148.1 RNA-binding protein [Streptococcus dysgalactiae subsp. dysgalactiae]MCB2847126.1 RNA-binding protein [Streptococcus dysgalactiae subsp. dysgalactiae]